LDWNLRTDLPPALGPGQISALIEIIPDNILLTDFQGQVLGCNQRFLDLLGYGRGEMLRLSLADLIHPEDLALRPVKFKELREGQTCVAERRFKRRDGNYVPVEISARAIDPGSIMGVVRDITPRRKADEALKESLDRFRLFDSLTEETILVHDQGIIVDVNRALADKLGYEIHEVIGKNLSEFTDKASLEKSQAFIKKGYPEGFYEISAKKKDGSALPLLVHGVDFEHRGRKLRASSGWDLTEIKRAQDQLRRTEENFRALIDSAPDAILVQREGKVVYANRGCRDLLGYGEKDGLVGKGALDIVHPDDRATVRHRIQVLIEGGRTQPAEIRLLRKDGSQALVESSSIGLEFGGGPATLVILRDLTERAKAEIALRESEERFKRFAEVTKEGIFIHEKGRILDVNQTLLDMLGRSLAEIVGTDGLFLLDEESGVRMRRMIAEGYPDIPYELMVRRKDGSIFPAEFHGRGFQYKGKDLRVVSVWDITDRNAASEKLMRYERLAAVGELAAGLAHEIRNPLAVISAAAQYVEKKTGEQSGLTDYLKDIRKQCQRLDTLIFDILDYSGRGSVGEVREVEMRSLLNEALNLAQSQMGPIHQKVLVEWKMSLDLPRVSLNAQRIQRVFINLILNSYQALGEGGGTLWISCALDGKGFLAVRVEDDGPGIPDKDLPRLFEPFFTSKKAGSGLGLPICKRIVEEHNGEIRVGKREPRGASFLVRIPVKGGKS